jgi:hypothetical protein
MVHGMASRANMARVALVQNGDEPLYMNFVNMENINEEGFLAARFAEYQTAALWSLNKAYDWSSKVTPEAGKPALNPCDENAPLVMFECVEGEVCKDASGGEDGDVIGGLEWSNANPPIFWPNEDERTTGQSLFLTLVESSGVCAPESVPLEAFYNLVDMPQWYRTKASPIFEFLLGEGGGGGSKHALPAECP